MLPHSFYKIIGNTCVENGVFTISCNVNKVLFSFHLFNNRDCHAEFILSEAEVLAMTKPSTRNDKGCLLELIRENSQTTFQID